MNNVIALVDVDHDPVCTGYRWEIIDQEKLASLVAWTMQGHSQHAEKVINSLSGTPPVGFPTIQQQAIQELTLPAGTGNEAARWHRDGLVFQHIAWLAAHVENQGNLACSIPHMVKAHKGFDALLVPLSESNRADSGIVICEEKATTNPRDQVRDHVWPEIIEIESGKRDAELNGELIAILRAYGVSNQDEFIQHAHWLNQKAYRVSITLTPAQDENERRKAIFSGYDQCAAGVLARRCANSLPIVNLRDWMDDFCTQVVDKIRES